MRLTLIGGISYSRNLNLNLILLADQLPEKKLESISLSDEDRMSGRFKRLFLLQKALKL